MRFPRWYCAAWTAVVFASAFALYLPAVAPTHLALDDWGYIYGSAFVKDGLSAANVAAAFTTFGHGGIWMPLTYVTYMLDISLFGQGWTAHHAVNAVIHAVNAAVLMHFILALAGGRGRRHIAAAALAALLWALNPARAEAVAWVASRKEELWTLFALCGLMAWLGWLRKGGGARYAGALALMALSCLSKPTAMCLPLLAGLVHAAFARGAKFRPAGYLPLFAIAAATGAIALFSQTHPDGLATVDLYTAPFGWRLLNAAVAAGVYLFQSVVPYGVYADWREVPGGWPLWSAVAFSTLSIAFSAMSVLWQLGAKHPGLRRHIAFAALWFAFSLLPVAGVFGSVGDNALASRYAYLPSMALAVPAAAGLAAAGRFGRKALAPAFALACLAAVSYAAAAVPVIKSFADDVSLATRTLEHDPDNWRALRTIGRDLAVRQGRMDDGIAMLRRSLALRPSQTTVESLAYLLACRGGDGDFAEVRRIAKAILREPSLDRSGMMLDALGVAAMREGKWAEAARHFSASLVAPARSYPNLHTMLNLGLSLANDGRRADAVMVLVKLRGVADTAVRERAEEALEAIKTRRAGKFEWR